MVGEACLPSNAYYPRTPDYTLCSGVHVCWSEHSDSSFVYEFMILNYGFGTMTATTYKYNILHFAPHYQIQYASTLHLSLTYNMLPPYTSLSNTICFHLAPSILHFTLKLNILTSCTSLKYNMLPSCTSLSYAACFHLPPHSQIQHASIFHFTLKYNMLPSCSSL